MTKTSTGLSENTEGLLCYLLGWVTGLIFLLLEPDNRFVRFHAMQSIVVFGSLSIITSILGFIPVIGWFFAWILGIVAFILWVVLMIQAYQGSLYKLPIVGEPAERWSRSVKL